MQRAFLFSLLLVGPSWAATAQHTPDQQTVTRAVVRGERSDQKALSRLAARNVVHMGAGAHYVAGNSVTLQPGFTAQRGAVFQATVTRVAAENAPTLTATAWPNPFVDDFSVDYQLPVGGRVEHVLTDVQGNVVQRVATQPEQQAGAYRQSVAGSGLPAGVYIYQIRTGNDTRSIKIVKQ